MTSASAWRAPVLLAAGIVVVDQATKHWAVNELTDDRTIEVFWTLQFNLAFNSGMAFSRGQGLGPFIAVIATVVIVWLLASLRGVGGRLATFGMGCVIGGAAGNLIDRAFRGDAWLRGSVVDFIDFQWFPIFNIADMAINIGAGALILNAILSARRGEPVRAPEEEEDAEAVAPASDERASDGVTPASELAVSDPADSELAVSDPADAELADAELADSDPAVSELAVSETVAADEPEPMESSPHPDHDREPDLESADE